MYRPWQLPRNVLQPNLADPEVKARRGEEENPRTDDEGRCREQEDDVGNLSCDDFRRKQRLPARGKISCWERGVHLRGATPVHRTKKRCIYIKTYFKKSQIFLGSCVTFKTRKPSALGPKFLIFHQLTKVPCQNISPRCPFTQFSGVLPAAVVTKSEGNLTGSRRAGVHCTGPLSPAPLGSAIL